MFGSQKPTFAWKTINAARSSSGSVYQNVFFSPHLAANCLLKWFISTGDQVLHWYKLNEAKKSDVEAAEAKIS